MMTFVRDFFAYYAARLRRNWPGYVAEFWPYLCVVFLAAVADFLSTYRFMSAGYIDDELHPLIWLVSRWFGPLAGPLIGKLCQLAAILFVTILLRPFARIVFIPVTLIYLYAAWYNVWGIHLYTPVFLQFIS